MVKVGIFNTGLLKRSFEEGTVIFESGGPFVSEGVLSNFEGGEGVPKVYFRKDPNKNPRS